MGIGEHYLNWCKSISDFDSYKMSQKRNEKSL